MLSPAALEPSLGRAPMCRVRTRRCFVPVAQHSNTGRPQMFRSAVWAGVPAVVICRRLRAFPRDEKRRSVRIRRSSVQAFGEQDAGRTCFVPRHTWPSFVTTSLCSNLNARVSTVLHFRCSSLRERRRSSGNFSLFWMLAEIPRFSGFQVVA